MSKMFKFEKKLDLVELIYFGQNKWNTLYIAQA